MPENSSPVTNQRQYQALRDKGTSKERTNASQIDGAGSK
jgi:hypothetical protein